MKIKLVVAFVVLLFASLAQADTLLLYEPSDPTVLVSVIAIPDGSAITSESFIPPGGSAIGLWIVDYSFADGTGFAQGDTNDDVFGAITFTLPVSSVTFGWLGDIFAVEASDGESFAACPNFYQGCGINSGVQTFAGNDITGLTWAGNDPGYGGISSLAYTLKPVNALEPSSLLLSAIGIAALFFLFTKLKIRAYLRRSPAGASFARARP
jgi:hypothetical protein